MSGRRRWTSPGVDVPAIVLFLALPGCHGARGGSPTSVAAPVRTPTAAADADVASSDAREGPAAEERTPDPSPLPGLSRSWAQDGDLTASGQRPTNDLARCPRAGSDIRVENKGLVPPPFVRFEGITTHACDAVLWVYLGCTAANEEGTSCESWTERLVLEPVDRGPAHLVGDVKPVMGANAGGLFVPFAFTRDDRWILLRAWMFPPGAGGGAVDYGVGVIAQSTRSEKAPLDVRPLPARDPRFYADLGCAIGLAGSDKTPSYMQPGFPSNNGGALVVVHLETLKARTLLEERDTTYTVDDLDENAGTLEVTVTRHTFGKDCPRGAGALSCSASTSTKRKLALPPCGAGTGLPPG